jgi:hypothetical protein
MNVERCMMIHLDDSRAQSWDVGANAQRLRRIVQTALPGAQIVRVVGLKADENSVGETTKGAGYGAPLRIDVIHAGREKALVLHTATPNEFGHDRRADRAEEMLLAADTFGGIPNHVRVLDVGAYRGTDDFVSLADTGEFYLLTTHAEGRVYADDLRHIARTGMLTALDIARVRALVEFLARLHSEKPTLPRTVYARSIRDTVGSGEGVFGIVDGYPEGVPAAPYSRLEHIEEQCLEWRFRLKRKHERLARTHGDFHPFNVLFDDRVGLAMLDTSRGSIGDPADDVTCMAINFAFFALGQPGAWRDALQSLWYGFWEGYLSLTGDAGVYDVAAPFFAWRGLVLANPKWYPELKVEDRERILGFVEKTLSAERFAPELADEFFDS